jgi:hypothetical protein
MCRNLGNYSGGCGGGGRTLGNYGPTACMSSSGSSTSGVFLDRRSSGTDAGSFVSGSWITRELNYVQNDNTSAITLSSNQLTITPGTYIFDISCPAYGVNKHQARLFNVTLGSTIINGSCAFPSGSSVLTTSIIKGQETFSSTTVLEIQHQCQLTRLTDGLGIASNFGSEEIYTQVSITKTS